MTSPPPLLSDADFAALMVPFAPFEREPVVAVAVSGGADSLALTLLAARWAEARGGRAIGVTVDHALRPESRGEAEQVGRWLAARNISHHILTWTGLHPHAGVQASARTARYGLLEEWASANGILHVLLAHHLQDQAETVMLRLGRGSGVDGLSAMAPAAPGRHVRWLRPLLGVEKERLRAVLTAWGQDWIEDPSNDNPAFARVRWRKLLPSLAEDGLMPRRLAATAARMARARAALEREAACAMATEVEVHAEGFAVIAADAFERYDEEIALRLLTRVVSSLGGGLYPPRHATVCAWFHRREDRESRTMAGCLLTPCDDGRWLVSREAGRMAPPVALERGCSARWDGRFLACAGLDLPEGVVLGALGETGWRPVVETLPPAQQRRARDRIPAVVRPTLPALWWQGNLCAVPDLGYNRWGDGKRRLLRWMVPAPTYPMTVAGRSLASGYDGTI